MNIKDLLAHQDLFSKPQPCKHFWILESNIWDLNKFQNSKLKYLWCHKKEHTLKSNFSAFDLSLQECNVLEMGSMLQA